jgi:hypothetical protein
MTLEIQSERGGGERWQVFLRKKQYQFFKILNANAIDKFTPSLCQRIYPELVLSSLL